MKLSLQASIINRRGSKGMTLIEVLVVLVLLAVILIPAVNALTAANRIWTYNDAINSPIAQANTSMTWISREIREAAQPAQSENSVIVEDSGQRLIIYRYNKNSSVWEKIIYQVSANKLSRVVISAADPATVISAAIPGVNANWDNLLEGITSTPVFSRITGSRSVDVNLEVSDTRHASPRFTPFKVASTYMIRSSEVGAITGDPVPELTLPPVVASYKVVVNPDSAKLIITDPNEQAETLYATLWPANATNKSITWSSSNTDWVQVEYDSNNSLQANIELKKKRSDFSDLDWFFLIPPGVTITAAPNGGGNSDTCSITIRKQ